MPTTEYLPTPPASVSDGASPNHHDLVTAEPAKSVTSTPFRYASPADDDLATTMPSFRRRVARGGRVMFDRRMPFRTRPGRNSPVTERFQFDSDDEDVGLDTSAEEQDTFRLMTHRAYLYGKGNPEAIQAQAARRAHIEGGQPAGHPRPPSANNTPAPTHQSVDATG